MDFEIKRLVEKVLEVSEENNKILRGIQRANRWAIAFRIFYWLIIIGLSVGAFYFIQPYIDQLMEVYGGLRGGVDQVQNLSEIF